MNVQETCDKLHRVQNLLDTAYEMLEDITTNCPIAYSKSDPLLLEDMMKHNVDVWELAKQLHGLS
jgi:hypothetical protein